MENENGNPNPTKEEDGEIVTPEIEENDDIEVLKEKYQNLSDANKKLYARTKKAEGFELKDDKWVKIPKENKEPKEIKPPKSKEDKPEAKSDDLDYGEKAFLRSYDIKGADEIALVKNWVKRTGDELDVAVEDEIFLAKLKSLRDAKASNDAIPKGRNRSTQPAQNDEAYWMAKIDSGQATLKDIPDVDIRRKVLNKRIEKEKSGSKFAPQSIIRT